MPRNTQRSKIDYRPFVIFLTLIIAFLLAKSTYYINYWPSDSYRPYIPTAAHLFELRFFSQMHDLPIDGQLKLTMHGKETLVLGIAVMQQLLHDYESLYPNVLLLIIATSISSVLFYVIFAQLFNPYIGLLAYILFTGCFWTYMYILQGAHQPLVLMNCLIVIFLLLQRPKLLTDSLAGIFLGFMLFSSPTAPIYCPYILTAFCYRFFSYQKSWNPFLSAAWVFCGGVMVFLLFTLPDPLQSIKEFLQFLQFSQIGNNFNIYYSHMYQYYPIPRYFRGAGLIWIFKYFFLILPVLFTVYWVSALYLLKESLRKPLFMSLVFLSLLPPIATEISHVAQFGRNYFSWFPGLIFLICWAAADLAKKMNSSRKKFIFGFLTTIFVSAHLLYNAHIFFTDIFPSKMTTTRVHQWLVEHRYKKVYVYAGHPYNLNLVKFLNNPKQKERIIVEEINNLHEAKDGVVYLLPITGKSIYKECRENDFYQDPELTRLYQSNQFSQYVLASFQTLASSRIWTQEEEICTYLDLILGLIKKEDRQKGLAYLLDARQLQESWR